MLRVCLFVVFWWGAGNCLSQSEDAHKRFTFAKSYFGVDFNYYPIGAKSAYLSSSQPTLREFETAPFILPSINIGGTHFWGYADFFVSIPLSNISFGKAEIGNKIDMGVSTGVRVYPVPLKYGKLRPLLGYKFAPVSYLQNTLGGQDARQTKVRSVGELGLGYQSPMWYGYVSYNSLFNSDMYIPISRTAGYAGTLPSGYFTLGVNFTIETTYTRPSKTLDQMNESAGLGNKNGFFVGAGPSSAFPTASSSHLVNQPFLDDKAMPSIFPDLAVGYHFTKRDVVMALSFRPIRQVRQALNFDQQLLRRSVLLEGYKFIADFHGFVPFVGVGVSSETLQLTETDRGRQITSDEQHKITPNIVFGWDIRPNRKADWFVLRTNLRYAPYLTMDVGALKLSAQYIEFNFIQFVCYPQRIKLYRSLSGLPN